MSKTINLKAAVEKYLEHLEAIGKSDSTRYTVRLDLGMLTAYLGEEKELAKILPVHVAGFFKSEAATTQPGKDGTRKPRAQPTILQIRRITRQFLVWAQERGYLTKAPLPKDEAAVGSKRQGKAKKAALEAAKETAPDAQGALKGNSAAESKATPPAS